MSRSALNSIALGLVGGAVGSFAGYYLFRWLLSQGLYGLILPPALFGLGAGLLARERSWVLSSLCAVAGLLVGLYSEWSVFPFVADKSWWYFVNHVGELRPVTKLLLAVGTCASFFLSLGGTRSAPTNTPPV